MAEYRVYFATEASRVVTVSADSREEAIDKAYEEWPGVSLCWQCCREAELGDFEVPVDKDYAVELVE